MKLTLESLKQPQPWEAAGIKLPRFDIGAMRARTSEAPTWVHFGAGNIFRGFIAVLGQEALEAGATQTGIIAAEAYDEEIIGKIYRPYDNLALQVIMDTDGALEQTVVASLSEGLATAEERDWKRLVEIFTNPALQMVSFTITEKGYNLYGLDGQLMPVVRQDAAQAPAHPRHVMAQTAALLYARYRNGGLPVAVVSMDNCSHNGEKLQNAVLTIARAWVDGGLADAGFVDYLNDTSKVTFPWSMIDKITPRPSASVQARLEAAGFESAQPVQTAKHTYIAPFVNTERPQYLVIEDSFPNGRPPIQNPGVFFTDRDTVEKAERMKVCTCLNPLHTVMAVFGCLLGYTLIADETRDEAIRALVHKVGYDEGLPVVTNPGIFDPKQFIDEVINVRLPNRNIPDTPQRIATDTSQKLGIRYGETIKAYRDSGRLDAASLVGIPLVIAGWCRYLLGVDDGGKAFEPSSDPLLDTLRGYVAGISLGAGAQGSKLSKLLSNKDIFGLDLHSVGLAEKIQAYFDEMTAGPGAVRATLKRHLLES